MACAVGRGPRLCVHADTNIYNIFIHRSARELINHINDCSICGGRQCNDVAVVVVVAATRNGRVLTDLKVLI